MHVIKGVKLRSHTCYADTAIRVCSMYLILLHEFGALFLSDDLADITLDLREKRSFFRFSLRSLFLLGSFFGPIGHAKAR